MRSLPVRSGPAAPLRVLTGVVSAGVAVGVGHLVASLIAPAASPLLAIGSTMIDLAPTPAKEFVVRTFGDNDKVLLVGVIGVVVAILAGVTGLVAWWLRRTALVVVGALGVVGAAFALFRPEATPLTVIPSFAAGIAGAAVLALLVRWGEHVRSGPAPEGQEPGSAVGYQSARGRRTFLVGLGGAGALAATSAAVGERVAAGGIRPSTGPLPTPVSAAPAIPAGAQVVSTTPFTTPIPDFYRVDVSLVTPRISLDGWTLTIDGNVDRPLTLTYDDLLAMPMIERDITLTCVSNEVGGKYVGTARWLGVPFSEIIDRVGVRDGVDQVFSYSLDSGYTCSTPYTAVSDGRDAMIVVGMNGEVLPDKNGFPARMLVPGLFGFVSATKWLQRIEFTTYAERTAYWTERDWATDAPILTQSRIDVPKSLSELPADKPVLAGVAWAQHRGIAKVEIRFDGGEWREAKLADDAGIDLWRQWTFVYDGPPGQHSAEVRATDADGNTQPEQRTKVFPDGARGWHQIVFNAQ